MHAQSRVAMSTNIDKDKIKRNFGSDIRRLRENEGWTQEELAERSGLHFTYIGQIERGIRNPSLINIYKLGKALKVNGSALLNLR